MRRFLVTEKNKSLTKTFRQKILPKGVASKVLQKQDDIFSLLIPNEQPSKRFVSSSEFIFRVQVFS